MSDSAEKPSNSKRDPLIGTDLGGYRISGILGRGGYAVVYRAVQVKLNRDVALKVLTEDEDIGLPEQVDAFLREARAAAALNHPCLVHVHDVGEAEGRHYMSMELVPGGNLARHIKTHGPMAWRDAMPIMRDLAEALECAHEHDLVHRDVKPANVLLTRSGGAKLADLGLSGEKKHAGTAAFMAPEQILRKDVDSRADLYSLGCSFFSMLAGRPPFNPGSSKRMLAAHVREMPPLLRDLDLPVPPGLDRLIDQLLAKDPDDRPQTAGDVSRALDRLEAASSVQPTRAPRTRRGRRGRPRSGPSHTSTIVGLILLVALAVGIVWAWKRFS